ncbi:amidohydrolase [Rhodoferax lacus]|uniref:Amidohydrolase n=1 Tax=Rhodoferax lacus TaxID=2184758 RepID=A0A3E1RGM5_9BURK|nr:amidohydrolase family protein [Rhodoferax lacus]RFO98535.1 amidohydrolase [Rhodoferax lacus]
MKIDTHQHYWRYEAQDFPWISDAMPSLQRDCLPADVGPALHSAGVDAVLAVQARSREDETDYLLGLAKTNPQIVGVVGWIDLCAADVSDKLSRYADQPLLKGFRHILQDEPQLPALLRNPDFNRGMKAVQKRGLVYEVLVFDRQMSSVLEFCGRHNAHWLVLDHVGKPCIRDWMTKAEVPGRWLACMRALAAMPHVVCKLSGLVTEADWSQGHGVQPQDSRTMLECFDRALDLFGPNRLLYGSDWPVCQLAAPYAEVHSLAQRWASTRLTQHEQDAFWGVNAQRCYALAAADQ